MPAFVRWLSLQIQRQLVHLLFSCQPIAERPTDHNPGIQPGFQNGKDAAARNEIRIADLPRRDTAQLTETDADTAARVCVFKRGRQNFSLYQLHPVLSQF
ncbi:hypothetical protein [Roseibium sediminicola]|uniref:Secreted protein n=1 Tax=Roseibium sediminicola TaxID=2933272 RepID=A0ABT0GWK4_9HYPH|nr:hypothetical protein [Roseibium sp. CAU 1639]MCK7613605.1 hypothetical protein [Roseibium sp. CAU 1639]